MSLLLEISEIVTTETTTYLTEIPAEAEETDNLCLIKTIDGRAPDIDLEGISLRNPSFALLIRDTDYENCLSRINTATNTLLAATSDNIQGIFLESDFIELERDKKGRFMIFANFKCKVKNIV